MRFYIVRLSCIFIAPFVAASSTAEDRTSDLAVGLPFKPLKISFRALADRDDSNYFANVVQDSFMEALRTVGMVSITNVPGWRAMKEATLSWDLHRCSSGSVAKVHQFPDGTVRRTLATHTLPGGYQHKFAFDPAAAAAACETFAESSDTFRKTVDGVVGAFAARLSSVLQTQVQGQHAPLLTTEDHYPFATLADVVENGEHLEHFHSYQSIRSPQDQDTTKSQTIEMHTDQGLLLAFTPGRMVHNKPSNQGALTTGFYIKLQDGTLAMVDFDTHDDIVILLGDGVNQYVNHHLPLQHALRATPHALTLPQHSQDEARVWYGRMVLPPSTAIHPQHNRTFQDIRNALIQASTSINHGDNDNDKQNTANHVLSLGCSSSAATMVARQLETMTCEGDTLMCWHRCMNITEAGVSDDICADRELLLRCINPRNQLWDNKHGDFYPGCAATDAQVATPYPPLPNAPRNEDECSDSRFDEFVQRSTPDYNHSVPLGNGAVFMWSVDNKTVHGKLLYNGLFGYLSIGFANIGGAKNGMHGANVLMATPGTDYSPVTGFNLTTTTSVRPYRISENKDEASFRFWDLPLEFYPGDQVGEPMLSATTCFTSMSFIAKTIYGQPFNVSGSDELIWAANGVDAFAGYHPSRGRFLLDWTTGEAKLHVKPIDDVVTATPTSSSVSPTTLTISSSVTKSCWFAIIISMSLNIVAAISIL
jgi:hypothetical protein